MLSLYINEFLIKEYLKMLPYDVRLSIFPPKSSDHSPPPPQGRGEGLIMKNIHPCPWVRKTRNSLLISPDLLSKLRPKLSFFFSESSDLSEPRS